MIQSELDDSYGGGGGGGVDVQPISLASPSDLQQQYADITAALQQQYQEAAAAVLSSPISQMPPTPCSACQADDIVGRLSSRTTYDRCLTFDEFVRTCREVQADVAGSLYGHTLLQVSGRFAMPVSQCRGLHCIRVRVLYYQLCPFVGPCVHGR